MKKFKFVFLLLLSMVFSGCLSHWFLDSSTRLQIENDTENCTLVGVDILSKNGTYSTWIDQVILPGERSRVVEEDWVGDFTMQIRYQKSAENKGNILKQEQNITFDGGSLFMIVNFEGDSLKVKFK